MRIKNEGSPTFIHAVRWETFVMLMHRFSLYRYYLSSLRLDFEGGVCVLGEGVRRRNGERAPPGPTSAFLFVGHLSRLVSCDMQFFCFFIIIIILF